MSQMLVPPSLAQLRRPAHTPRPRAAAILLGVLAVAAALLIASPALGLAPATAGDWGGIEPGASTIESVRERWGAPSKETRQKVEGYDTVQWVYEAARAPGGLKSMTVDFGLLAAAGYKPMVVRLLTLEPKPGIFGLNTVVQGWGEPDGTRGKPKEDLIFFYQDGLLVYFDKEDFAYRLVFSLPQPGPPAVGSQPGQRAPADAPAPPAGGATPSAPPAGAPTQRR